MVRPNLLIFLKIALNFCGKTADDAAIKANTRAKPASPM